MHSLERFSESFEAITAESPSGAPGWLRTPPLLGRGLRAAHDPDGTARPPPGRRAAPLGRSSVARMTRYEALALLRCSAYGDLVDSVLREMVLDPGHPGHLPPDERPLGAADARPAPLGRNHAAPRVDPRRPGASFALQSMLVIGGLRVEDWESLVPHFTSAWHDDGADATRRTLLTDLCAALPRRCSRRSGTRAGSRPSHLPDRRSGPAAGAAPTTGSPARDRGRRVRAAGPPRGAPPGAAALRGHVRPPRRAHVDLGVVRRGLPVCPRPGAAARRATRSRTGRGEPVRRAEARRSCHAGEELPARRSAARVRRGQRVRAGRGDRRAQRSAAAAGGARAGAVGRRVDRAQDASRSRGWPRTHAWRTSRRIVAFRTRRVGAPGGGWIAVVGSWSERERLPHPRTGSHSLSRPRGGLDPPRAAPEI